MRDRETFARIVFCIGAAMGVLSAGAGALYAAAMGSSGTAFWIQFVAIWAPVAALWMLFCYGAYRGLASRNVALRVVFWLFVLFHVFVFPIGTAISAACLWLSRDMRRSPDDAAGIRVTSP